MQLARHPGKGAVDDLHQLAGLGIGLLTGHKEGVAEVGVAEGAELQHLRVRYLIALRGALAAKDVQRKVALGEQPEHLTLGNILAHEQEIVHHGHEHAAHTTLAVALLGIRHRDEIFLAVLREELAQTELLAVERADGVPRGRHGDFAWTRGRVIACFFHKENGGKDGWTPDCGEEEDGRKFGERQPCHIKHPLPTRHVSRGKKR